MVHGPIYGFLCKRFSLYIKVNLYVENKDSIFISVMNFYHFLKFTVGKPEVITN